MDPQNRRVCREFTARPHRIFAELIPALEVQQWKGLLRDMRFFLARVRIGQGRFENVGAMRRTGIVETAAKIWRTDGMRGFFRGVNIACVG